MSSKQIDAGNDSFLDIVANLVGVLIILVVIVGAQATSSWQSAKPKEELIEQVAYLEDTLSQNEVVIAKFEIDNQQLEQQVFAESQLAARLAHQRHQMLMQLEIAKREIAKEREERQKQVDDRLLANDSKVRENLRRQSEFEIQKKKYERELEELERAANAVSAIAQPKADVIDHYPSPIAKTVFAEEVHFRLSGGKLVYVPMDELIAKMKSEWKVKAEKLKRTFQTVETVGPIGDFRMQYELLSEDEKQQTRAGVVERKRVRFKQFQLLPVANDLGEPITLALTTGSEFQSILRRHDPKKTTVSVWVYPDSYSQHGDLKNWLHQNGFQMASWPMDNGKRISGGPDGFKASAQ